VPTFTQLDFRGQATTRTGGVLDCAQRGEREQALALKPRAGGAMSEIAI
jgi:hypothetical protein